MDQIKRPTDRYPLGYTQEEARRLADQAAYFGDLTTQMLQRAGIERGMRVLDLGCGIGDVSLLARSLVGAEGFVLGIDRSHSSVEAARRRAESSEAANVRFAAAELNTFATTEVFDAVIGRLVLLYQSDPSTILRRYADFLRPGGIIAFQEIDIDMSSEPHSELLEKVGGWIRTTLRASGADPHMGRKLLRAFLDAGLPRPTMMACSRVESGPNSVIYAHHAEIVRSLLPMMHHFNVATADEVAIESLADRLRLSAMKLESATFESRLVSAWSRLVN